MANPLGTCALNSKLNTKYETNKLYCCRRCCLLVHKLLQTFINFYKKSSNHVLFIGTQTSTNLYKLLQKIIKPRETVLFIGTQTSTNLYKLLQKIIKPRAVY
ncbi:uncharacterized protein LOC126925705 isoform X5 [Bombus affinis]|uniref:uncharacterized protein LOC126925705 isoform X5 n=1 Tax=Bombus affinis TaxID=309941 RepID=UPI0021B7FEAC|nr:uncharacterized protein LOC126925705 isoform X5 [Bombus affinis]